jgi:putative ABC transport system ATP-binding protein
MTSFSDTDHSLKGPNTVLQTPTEGAALRDGAATAAPVSSAVAASAVTRRYGSGEAEVDALRGVTIDVPRGQFAAIMGPSGSGKSTLMHVLAGLDTPTSGTVHIAGEDITKMNDAQLTKLRRAHIGFVFQAFNLLPTLTAQENILLPLALAGRKVDTEWFEAVVERVGLADRTKHRPSELSGGQQQRVAVARALVAEPTVLFADEPTGNLDSRSSHDVLELLHDAAVSFGQTTVMVTHDPGAAAAADRVVFLADGSIAGDMLDPDEATILEGIREATR